MLVAITVAVCYLVLGLVMTRTISIGGGLPWPKNLCILFWPFMLLVFLYRSIE